MKFKLKDGRHVEDGRTSRKGDIVESDNQLDKMFPEKFELVEGQREPEREEEVPGKHLQDATEKVGTHVKDNPETPKSAIGSLHNPRRSAPTLPDKEDEEDEDDGEGEDKPSHARKANRRSSHR